MKKILFCIAENSLRKVRYEKFAMKIYRYYGREKTKTA